MDYFLEANIILRHLLADDEEKAKRSKGLLARLERNEAKARTSDMVIAEVVLVLERSYRVSREAIRDYLLPIILFRGLFLPRKTIYLRVFDLYTGQNFSYAAAYNVALMERLKITQVASYNQSLDRIEGIKRFEP